MALARGRDRLCPRDGSPVSVTEGSNGWAEGNPAAGTLVALASPATGAGRAVGVGRAAIRRLDARAVRALAARAEARALGSITALSARAAGANLAMARAIAVSRACRVGRSRRTGRRLGLGGRGAADGKNHRHGEHEGGQDAKCVHENLQNGPATRKLEPIPRLVAMSSKRVAAGSVGSKSKDFRTSEATTPRLPIAQSRPRSAKVVKSHSGTRCAPDRGCGRRFCRDSLACCAGTGPLSLRHATLRLFVAR